MDITNTDVKPNGNQTMNETATKTYSYDELSDKSKEKALEEMRRIAEQNIEMDYMLYYVKEMGAAIGIQIDDIFYTGFYSQGDGACFTGEYTYKAGSVKAIKNLSFDEELRNVAINLQDTQKKAFYGLSAKIKYSGRYCHELCTNISVWNDKTDNDANDQQANDIAKYLRDFMLWSYSLLKSEYEFQLFDSTLIDSINANSEVFDEYGTMK